MKSSFVMIITASLIINEALSEQDKIDYSNEFMFNLENYQTFCPNGKMTQPQPFTKKSDVEAYYPRYKICVFGWFNEQIGGSFMDILVDFINDDTQICFFDKNYDKKEIDGDCYSYSTVSIYHSYTRDIIDLTQFSFNVDEWDNQSFRISGQSHGVWTITGIQGLGQGSIKKNKFDEKYTFIFENGLGILSKVEMFDDGGLRKKILKYASKLSRSLSLFDENIDYFNRNNDYIQINQNMVIIIAFSMIVLSILVVILLIFCTIYQWICSTKQTFKKIEQFSDEEI